MAKRKFHEEGLIGFFGMLILILFIMGLGMSGGSISPPAPAPVTSPPCRFTRDGDCPDHCSFTAGTPAVAEACVDTDSSGDDCSGFIAGDESSCGGCDYTAPRAAVKAACTRL